MKQKARQTKTARSNKAKLYSIYIIFTLLLLLYAARLFQYQYLDKDIIANKANEELVRHIPYKAMRGQILDRNGEVLAFSRISYDVEVVHEPFEVRMDILEAIKEVYPEADLEDMKERMAKTEFKYATVLEDIPKEVSNIIEKLDPSTVGVINGFKRIYPDGDLAAKVLGTISTDGDGLSGIEESFNEELKGVDGFIETKTDIYGRRNPFAEAKEQKPIDGRDVVLTIDSFIQHMIQSVARNERVYLDAKEVIIIVQDAKTSEILGMTSSYSYDPNDPNHIMDESLQKAYDEAKTDEARSEVLLKMWSNPLVSMNYEPGSTMKIVGAVSCLEEGIVAPSTPFYCGGYVEVDYQPVRCVSYPNSHGALDFAGGFRNSCNVVFTEAVAELGRDKYYDYLDRFGLFKPIDIGLPMAYASIYIPKEEAYDVDFARMSFGHAISITPLHLTNIASVVANDGKLVPPSVVKQVGSKDYEKKKPEIVCSPETAATVRDFMETVTNDYPEMLGVSGYRVGVKTGTSEKFVDGEYRGDHLICSIIQVAPIDKPVINVMVIVDEPKTITSTPRTAGRIASRISADCLKYLKVAPSEELEDHFVNVPDFVESRLVAAEIMAEESSLKVKYDLPEDAGAKDALIVKSQNPKPGSLVTMGSVVELIVAKEEGE